MNDEKGVARIHPEGEQQTEGMQPEATATSVDTFAGKVQIKWAPERVMA